MSHRAQTILAAMLFSAAYASATPIANPYSGATSSELSTWAGALSGGYTTLTFPGTQSGSTWTSGGFAFSGSGLSWNSANAVFLANSIAITPPTGETAILLYIYDPYAYANANSFTLTLSDGESSGAISVTSCGGSNKCWWYGFTDSTPITSLALSADSGNTLGLGELYYGTAEQPAPRTAEVATFFLAGGGLLLLLSAGRKLSRIRTA